MYMKEISLNWTADVKAFVEAAQGCVGEVKVSSADGKYSVDGKSLLGIFSLDLSKPVMVSVEKEDEAKKIFKKF